jgi:hypothetical protein
MLVTSIAAGGAAALMTTPAAAGKNCTDAVKTKTIKALCESGGFNKVKPWMKEVEKAAKAAGMDKDCTDCHVDKKEFKLKPDGRDNFKEWVKKAGKALEE